MDETRPRMGCMYGWMGVCVYARMRINVWSQHYSITVEYTSTIALSNKRQYSSTAIFIVLRQHASRKMFIYGEE